MPHCRVSEGHEARRFQQIFRKGEGSSLKSQADVAHGSPEQDNTLTSLQHTQGPEAFQSKPEYHGVTGSLCSARRTQLRAQRWRRGGILTSPGHISHTSSPIPALLAPLSAPARSNHWFVSSSALALPVDATHLTGTGQKSRISARMHACANSSEGIAVLVEGQQKGDF